MSTWTSPPSPSTASSESPFSPFLLACHVASTVPRRLWDAYMTYLWYYKPGSWVGRVASAFQILAVLLVLPVALLTLLDVTSYVIARTLGIVDDVKASTSDADTIALKRNLGVAVPVPVPVTASAMVYDTDLGGPARTSEGLRAPEDSVDSLTDADADGEGHGMRAENVVDTVARPHGATRGQCQGRDASQNGRETEARMGVDAVPRAYYFAGEEDLRLAGEGVFSPAVSMPPSPVTPRHPVPAFLGGEGEVTESEDVLLRRRTPGARRDNLVHT